MRVKMFKWLSKLIPQGVDPRDVASMAQGLSIMWQKLEEQQKQLNRMERKVYRDNGREPDVEQLEQAFKQPSVVSRDSDGGYKAGDQIPPDVQI